MTKILTDPEEIRRELPEVYAIFFDKNPTSTRRPDETLHDYLTRKKIKCFCPICKQTKLVL